ncbi:MAG: hypothetical protein LBJ07_01140 [Actinomycetes bacterium]|jgi:hypothetical protein|nr:hypothetical protein [Actinomycetes bacterium]
MSENRTFDSTEMRAILTSLNDELAQRNLTLELALYGGVAVMLYYENPLRKDLTGDFDGIILNRREFGRHPEVFAEIAKTYHLPDDWINSQIVETLNEMKREELVNYGNYSHIKIKMPRKEQLLAMKIKAARYYPKYDFEDARQIANDLGISSLAALAAIVDEYIPAHLIGDEQRAFMTALVDYVDNDNGTGSVNPVDNNDSHA